MAVAWSDNCILLKCRTLSSGPCSSLCRGCGCAASCFLEYTPAVNLLRLVFSAITLSATLAWTALAVYLAKPEPEWKWTLVSKTELGACEIFTLTLKSQVWEGIPWEHDLVSFRPKDWDVKDRIYLLINGGAMKPQGLPYGVMLATAMKAPVALLMGIPNQPLFDGKRDVDHIAETFVRYRRRQWFAAHCHSESQAQSCPRLALRRTNERLARSPVGIAHGGGQCADHRISPCDGRFVVLRRLRLRNRWHPIRALHSVTHGRGEVTKPSARECAGRLLRRSRGY